MCFGENSKWRKIYPDGNGRGLFGEMHHDPRNPGKKEFWFSDLRFKSYKPKDKVGCYSATMRPIDIIKIQLILEIIMNLPSKFRNYSPYALRGKNTWMWILLNFSIFLFISMRNLMHGYIFRICSAPYGRKLNCFWLWVESSTSYMWYKFGVDWMILTWFMAFLVKWAPPTNFRQRLRTNETENQNSGRPF